MKTPLERIELAEKELKAAKEALQPEYIEIISANSSNWYNKDIGKIYKIIEYNDSYAEIDKYHNIEPSHFKPSTKEAFDKQNEIILVPDCIKFENIYKGLGIVFNDNKQTLWLQSDFYSVARSHKIHIKDGSNFKLTKCERSDLKAGDVAFRTDSNGGFFKKFYSYCIILDSEKVVFIEDNADCCVSECYYDHWYKVEKI